MVSRSGSSFFFPFHFCALVNLIDSHVVKLLIKPPCIDLIAMIWMPSRS